MSGRKLSARRAKRSVDARRIQRLNDAAPARGDYVLYWMQGSQRADFNPALEHAVERANELEARVIVAFGLMDGYPEANLRHYTFMLEGLQETQESLEARGIRMVVRRGHPAQVALELGEDASLIVCDRGYLRHQKEWRLHVARKARCEVVQVEGDVVVPVDVASDKCEYAARTIRPKILRHLDDYLVESRPVPLGKDSLGIRIEGMDLSDVSAALRPLKIDRSVGPVSLFFKGGTREAQRVLRRFLKEEFPRYAENRNQPQTDSVSHMSKYLHFGQISPVQVALAARDAKGHDRANRETFLEELIVRRELAQNHANFHPDYDGFAGLPRWAIQTLLDHARDKREHLYTREELEAAETHDEYWNAAMKEMKHTGFMHNYMRMYWGKKILEWMPRPDEAFRTAIEINNKYFVDGRDANSYTGVAWVFGRHDRPWGERKIFGTIRYMSAEGLERKCDIDGYVQKVERLVARAKGTARP